VRKPCPRHPAAGRYPSGKCRECDREHTRARRAAFRKAHPKKLSARERARRAGRLRYWGSPCPRNHLGGGSGNRRRTLRYVKGSRCVECGRSWYPAHLSKAAKERKKISARNHSRRRARALRVLNQLIGGGITI
jgi:hypothetical protein